MTLLAGVVLAAVSLSLAKGYDVTLVETSGGHDPYNWEASLPQALDALLPWTAP